MDDKNENERFTYTYSATQQAELKKIRQKYVPAEEDKMEHIRRLDQRVQDKGAMVSIVIGIIGVLMFGGGMSLCMVLRGVWFIPGIILGLLGLVVAAAAYPIYNRVIQREREKIAPEIIRLTDELMK